MYEEVLVRKTTQTYVGMFHPLVRIQGHRHTERSRWCSHRQCWLDKCPSDWLLPPNTHQRLCTIKKGSYESERQCLPLILMSTHLHNWSCHSGAYIHHHTNIQKIQKYLCRSDCRGLGVHTHQCLYKDKNTTNLKVNVV